MRITETSPGAIERLFIGIISFAAVGVAALVALIGAGCLALVIGLIWCVGRAMGAW